MENTNLTEQPLVGLGEIANYLKLSQASARKELKKKGIEGFKLGRYRAIYPSDLRMQLRNHKTLI